MVCPCAPSASSSVPREPAGAKFVPSSEYSTETSVASSASSPFRLSA